MHVNRKFDEAQQSNQNTLREILDEGYKAMASDNPREQQAREWVNDLFESSRLNSF